MFSYRKWKKLESIKQPIAFVLNSDVNGLGVIRSLGKEGVPVVALDPNPLAIGLYSKYAMKIVCPDPLYLEEGFIRFLIDIGKGLNTPGVLFPTADVYVVAIAKARDRLKDYYKIPLSPWEVIKEIVDKGTQYKKAMESGIAIPKTYVPKTLKDLMETEGVLQYPVVLKPVFSQLFTATYRIKGIRIENKGELIEKFEKFQSAGHPMLIQEIIGGGIDQLVEFFSYRDREGELWGAFIQRKLDQYPPDFGTGTSFESVSEPEIVEIGTRLLKVFGYYGISFSEFKRDPSDGQLKMIELNPRTTHCNSLATECGVNIPFLAYQDILGKKKPVPSSPQSEANWIYPEKMLFYQRKIPFLKPSGGHSSKKIKWIYSVFSFKDSIPEWIYPLMVLFLWIRIGLQWLGLIRPIDRKDY